MKKPIIGIPLRYNIKDDGTTFLYMNEQVRLSILKSGGEVLTLTPVQNVDYYKTSNKKFPDLTDIEKERIDSWLSMCDGFFLPGGTKFTEYDRYILDYAIRNDIPVLAVCLSMQMMSTYKNDVVIEENDLKFNHNQNEKYKYAHSVKVNNNSLLYKIIGKEEFLVNSFHKRHIKEPNLYKITAISEDGIVEGIEYPENTFNIGVQWHPEIMFEYDENANKLMKAFVEVASKKKNRETLEIVV